jgi:hypothetical protein
MQHGGRVRTAQQRLNKNPFKQDFMDGPIDGQFGPQTGRACIRAKYWLGYPRLEQRPVYGARLDGFLSGKRKLPEKFKASRQARLKKAREKPLRAKALDRARKDIGMKERPAGSNRCEISRRWGMTGPWCAMAVSLWYLDSGSKAFRHRVDWAYVPYLLANGVDGRRGLALTSVDRVKAGDIVCFDWEQNGVADHVGLFEKWIRKGSTFQTVEGNTAVGNNSNGGQVMRRQRSLSQVARLRGHLGLIHVGR